jgi:hypothetical protein
MKLPRRQFLQLAAGAAALPFAPHVARAQAYPARPVRIMAFPAMSPFSQQLEYKCILGHEAFGIQPSGSEGA